MDSVCPVCGGSLQDVADAEGHVNECLESLMGATQLSEGDDCADEGYEEPDGAAEEDGAASGADASTEEPELPDAERAVDDNPSHILSEWRHPVPNTDALVAGTYAYSGAAKPARQMPSAAPTGTKQTTVHQPSWELSMSAPLASAATPSASAASLGQIQSSSGHSSQAAAARTHNQQVPSQHPGCLGAQVLASQPVVAPKTAQPHENSGPTVSVLKISVQDWLQSLGLSHHIPAFVTHEVDAMAAPLLRDTDLQVLGVSSAVERAAILASLPHNTQQYPAHELQRLVSALTELLQTQPATEPHPPTQYAAQLCVPAEQRTAGGAAVAQTTVYNALPPPHAHRPTVTAPAPMQAQPDEQSGPSGLPPPQLHPMFRAQPQQVKRITSFFGGTDAKSDAGRLSGHARPQKGAAGKRSTGSVAERPQGSNVGRGKGPQQRGSDKAHRPERHAAAAADAWVAGRGAGEVRGVPPWHTLPGTRFTVDCFGPQAARVQNSNGFWILSHFHADHYRGLTRHFLKGTILCSEVTARLVESKLKVPVDRIRALKLHVPYVIDGVTLTLVDANHCPGAAMIVAEAPGRPPVLHCGDCRLSAEMQSNPVLQRLQGKGTILVLDTTYCDPQYCFPTQQQTLDYTLEAVRSELFNPRALFVFGTYTIGKERLFLEVAHKFKRKVYVSKDKMAVLQCCGLSHEYLSLLTTNHLETNFHAVALGKVNLEGLAALLLSCKGRYNTVVGIQPTGWAMERQAQKGSCGRRIQKGMIIMHSVPYSEHSSFRELHDFCTWLQPASIIPSVNNDSGAARDKMVSLLRQPLSAVMSAHAANGAAAGTRPITEFMRPVAGDKG